MICCFTQDDGDRGWVAWRDGEIVDDSDERIGTVRLIQNGVEISAPPFGVRIRKFAVYGYVRSDCKNPVGRYKQAAFYASIFEVLHPVAFANIVSEGLSGIGIRFSRDFGADVWRRLRSFSTRCIVCFSASVFAVLLALVTAL